MINQVTITEGTIVIKDIVDGAGNANEFVRTLAFWNANFKSGYANPIDEALKSLHIADTVLPKKLGEIPYDFVRKRLSIAVETAAEKLLISKGAYNEIGAICTSIRLADGSIESYPIHQPALQKQFEQYGANGFRVIAVCYKTITKDSITKEDETTMTFAGFILLQDPVKAGLQIPSTN